MDTMIFLWERKWRGDSKSWNR